MSRLFSDLLRIFSVSFIVFNHVSWPYYSSINADPEHFLYNFCVFVQQLGKPSTIIFLFLSGLAFSGRAASKSFNSTDFYKSRFLRILPAYVTVSLLYIILKSEVMPDWQTILFELLTGTAYYHLYFVILILVLYLFFPLLRKWKYSLRNMLILWTSFLVLLLLSSLVNPYFSPYFFNIGKAGSGHDDLFLWIDYFLFGIPVFISGMWIGVYNLKNISSRVILISRKRLVAGLALVLFMLFLTYSDFFFRLANGLPSNDAGRTWRISVMAYGAAIVWLLLGFAERESGKLVSRMSRAGFLVYLFHPFVIDLLKPFMLNHPYEYMVSTIGLSWVLGLVIQEFSVRYKPVGMLMGEGDRIVKYRKGLDRVIKGL